MTDRPFPGPRKHSPGKSPRPRDPVDRAAPDGSAERHPGPRHPANGFPAMSRPRALETLAHDRPMSLPDAAAYLGRITGQKPHVSTLWRWCLKGCKGVKLDSICIGGKRFVTAAAIDYFIDASTNRQNDPRGASAASPPASSPPLSHHVMRHNERRRAQIEAARRRLDELTGVTKRARSGRKAAPPIRSPESPGRPGPDSARRRPG